MSDMFGDDDTDIDIYTNRVSSRELKNMKRHAGIHDPVKPPVDCRSINQQLEAATVGRRLALENEIESLRQQLAKAEQRVAEACALQVATETKFHWLDAARVAKEIRSGEWRKFVKEV